MRAVLSVVGKDRTGILALVSNECLQFEANIEDVSQTVMQDVFNMFMIVDINKDTEEFLKFVNHIEQVGKENNLVIHVMHEDIFNAMHTI
ncbi:ACT domain-containing protein [Anaerorhabdus sp.]|jgi:ACT domain-containing protein|uniref:ACT domain-containing protein n=1 Tax=Anaerorhabdus sp. TaxID=1872524 RepID=UPI002FC59CA9